ncbi:MAG: sugar phosphate isomerase/epimerase family protein [Mahellales bacterium]|jgi:sugar phosphate isomerase/epimerase
MKKNIKFGSCLPVFGNCADRYVQSGYGQPKTLRQMLEGAAQVKEIEGVELVGNWHINDENFEEVKGMLNDLGLKVSMMVPDLWTQGKWGKGTFTAKDEATRRAAIDEVKKAMDMAADVGCDKVDVWFGQDGFDYPFQADYIEAWDQLIEGLRECADYRKDIKICLEYKLKEPRTHLFVSTAAKTRLLINDVGRDNVGILCDLGHAQAAQENVADAIAISNELLWYIHINDNYDQWDDDMMFGSVHTIETIEALYWLERIGYDDYYTLDMNPYREDGIEAARESIAWVIGLRNLIDEVGYEKFTEVIKYGDPTKSSKLLREAICR